MRIVLVISLAAAALAESASSSTLDSASPVSAVDGQDAGSVKTGNLRSGVPDEGRSITFPAFFAEKLQSLKKKLTADKLLHSIGYQSVAEKTFLRMNKIQMKEPKYFASHDFTMFYGTVKRKTTMRDPDRVIVELLLPVFKNDEVSLAKRLAAGCNIEAEKNAGIKAGKLNDIVEAEKNAGIKAGKLNDIKRYEVSNVLNALVDRWAKGSDSMDDIFANKINLGAYDPVAQLDLTIAFRFVKQYEKHKRKERTIWMNRLSQLYKQDDESQQIKLPKNQNPMLDELERILFPIWLAQEKKPEDVVKLLKAGTAASEFSAASRLSDRYRELYKGLEPHLKTKK